ncbi:MAG: DTW domain-containing protein [Cephaloticoccus sp.]|nr:DTW domain-containing protein [Cephaloticoccus sp.]MCF7761184.1 DTW domain-containing protein [Cephaloticoccus sp.]
MARSVIFTQTPRCARCSFVPRWCICAGFQAIDCPLQIEVLMHRREIHRPTSTGRLINRVMLHSRLHPFATETPPNRDAIVAPDSTPWILHPRGESMPSTTPPANLQVILLDGSWREAARMTQTVSTWGRLVRLPMHTPGRYWLRKQQGEEGYSTAEALLVLLGALGLKAAEAQLRLQFELHVYAGLRSRGAINLAEDFLATSPLPAAMPALLEQLHQRRPEPRET